MTADFGRNDRYRSRRNRPRDVGASGATAPTVKGVECNPSLPGLPPGITPADLARMYRDAMRDKSYQLLPLGQDAGDYLRIKRKRLTPASHRDYESILDKLARYFADLQLEDFEPPIGTSRLEEFLDDQWGSGAPRTYNKALSILRDFFKHQILRGRLQGDPTLAIERARSRQVHRETWNVEQMRAIIAGQDDLRDRICARLLLHYGLRKGALLAIQFKHFDHQRKRVTVFTKGEKIREVPLPDPHFWMDLERHILDAEAQPHHYLLYRVAVRPNREPGMPPFVKEYRDKPMGVHGSHNWWYRCLENAGVVAKGTTSGERMHKARHSAGQRVLDATGNLKAVQMFLGHKAISTTGDTYVDWDIDQLTATMASVLRDLENEG